MYPLNVKFPDPAVGFAVANDEAEHASLTAAGYTPAFVPAPAHDRAALLDQAEQPARRNPGPRPKIIEEQS